MASRIEMWPLDRLVPYERNARTHSDEQVTQIAHSIIEFGFTQPILVDSNDGILAGHGRLLAARKLAMSDVPVIPLDHLSDAQKRACIIADNKLAENAGWDDDMLQAELSALKDADYDLGVIGFSQAELDDLLEAAGDPIEGATDADDVPEVAEEIVSEPGDLWLLGYHRLLVGDSMKEKDVKILMEGEKADALITDPPYNVAYGQARSEDGRQNVSGSVTPDELHNDNLTAADYIAFLDKMCHTFRRVMKDTTPLYLFYAWTWFPEVKRALEKNGLWIQAQIIWAMNTFSLRDPDERYHHQHESLLYCGVKGSSSNWYGDSGQSTLWMEKEPARNRLHPTMKPVELMEKAIYHATRRGELVVDLFGGSGSTLIAAERSGRRCRMMELDPKYADVILRRWTQHTRKQPVRANGTSFMQTERERLVLAKKRVVAKEKGLEPEKV